MYEPKNKMNLVQKIGSALVAGAMLITSAGCTYFDEQRALFEAEQTRVIQTIEETSPFNQTPVEAPLPDHSGDEEWYHDHAFVAISVDDVVYEKNGNLYLARGMNEDDSQIIAENIRLKERYLFGVDLEGDGNSDIYLIDWNRNIRKIRNDDGRFYDKGIVASLDDYLRYLPEQLELGDINADDLLDVIYEGKIPVFNKSRNAVLALVGDGRGGFIQQGPIFYLGNNSLDGLIARDVDDDGDSDIIYKLSSNDDVLYGLENLTIESNNPAVFRDGFVDKVDDFSNFIFWFIILYPILFNIFID